MVNQITNHSLSLSVRVYLQSLPNLFLVMHSSSLRQITKVFHTAVFPSLHQVSSSFREEKRFYNSCLLCPSTFIIFFYISNHLYSVYSPMPDSPSSLIQPMQSLKWPHHPITLISISPIPNYLPYPPLVLVPSFSLPFSILHSPQFPLYLPS